MSISWTPACLPIITDWFTLAMLALLAIIVLLVVIYVVIDIRRQVK